jgi:Cu(I)/Ag(I) efflux system membrane fusion protein
MDYVPVYADAGDTGATVSVSAGMRQALGVRTARVERGPLARRVEAVATVAYDARGVREVRVRAEGWVEGLQVRAAGERVRAGQTLFTVYSPKLATTRQDLERAQALNDPELVAAAEARLKALGAAGGRGSRVAYSAPVDGVVSELMVYEGTRITPEMVAARITPLGKVWVVAAVPESASGGLAPGASAVLRFAAYPGETLQAKVTEVLPELDAATRTVQARLTVENADARLRPGMIGTASIETGAARDVVQVPLDAVIRTGRGERVVVALGAGRFATREVVTGLESGDRAEVTRGLAAGDEVVVSGQFLIDSESNVRSSLSRLNGDAPTAGASAPGAAGPHAGHGAPEPRP